MASSSSCNWNWSVFLSFRGEDTRKTFIDHLYSALVDRKIPTYKDDETLPRGESIGPSLFKAIEGSQIAVVIFSKNYADSSWCLEELSYIMKCKDNKGLIVMPIFYDVDPSEVRKQKGDFGRGFSKQEAGKSDKVESWRKALVDASEIAGWEPKNIANGHEAKVIKEIVDTISDKLFSINFYVDEDLVGMSARLQELEAQLDIGSYGVRMVGVWGVGGGGKTTLASSLYMKISRNFQGHCIIDNIREESSRHGLITLQENLLSRLLKTKMNLQSVEEGKHMIKSRLNHSNVLILLDDVDDCKQLDALVGSHNWFGSGTRIIITTRDEHLLRTHKVDHVCPVTLLSHEEAVMLFNKHAYNKNNLIRDYEKLSLHVVSYCDGLPLAIKVLGSFLYDKDEKEWVSSLDRLKDIPEMEIVEKLKISYDGLQTLEKELFLDIACFFIGKRTKCHSSNFGDDAMELFEDCGYHPHIGIKVLTQKSLISIVDDRFDMHDMVQEMAYYIVRGEHPNNPDKHSRVWIHEEIMNMCLGDASMENNKIEAIKFKHYGRLSPLCKIVSNMKKLRWLSFTLEHVHDENVEGPNFLSNELQYIRWVGYPKSPFPDSFQPMRLATLKVSTGLQKQLWKDYKYLPNLKVLILKDMKNLLSTPNFDGLPCLQKLTLNNCAVLQEVHPSLGKLANIKCVSVTHCDKLRMFPTIVRMEKLECLEITDCQEIVEFPKIESKLKSLVKLYLSHMGIDVLLSSIADQCPNLFSIELGYCCYSKKKEVKFYGLKHLEEFKFNGSCREKKLDLCCILCCFLCLNDGIYAREWYINDVSHLLRLMIPHLARNLRKLDLGYLHLKDGEVLYPISELSNLQELNLSGNDFTRLDFSLCQLTRLKLFNLSECKRLVELPKLPSSVVIFVADDCYSLTTFEDFYINCKWLCEVSIVDGGVVACGSRLLQCMLEGIAIKKSLMILRLEGIEIAKQFRPPLVRGRRCRMILPDNWSNDFSGFLMCTVHTLGSDPPKVNMEQAQAGMDYEDDVVWEESLHDQSTLVWYVPFASITHMAWWDSTYKEVLFSVSSVHFTDDTISGFGVTLVDNKNGSGSGSGLTETSTIEEESEIYNYMPKVEDYEDSTDGFEFRFCFSDLSTYYDGVIRYPIFRVSKPNFLDSDD